MCGICGIFNFDRQQHVQRSVLEEMNRQIFHRGPDDSGMHVDGNIGLAMRRLSIIDLQTGQQPVTNENNSVWLVFNGEIYNHQELRAGLEQRGHRYRSHSDTETIVHLYEEYGHDCVRHLRGMFAIAIWDSRRRTLFLARDRLGIKPLYFLKTPSRILFASEIKSLLAFPGVAAEFNREVLPEFLAFGYTSSSRTMFAGIEKLMPGETLEIGESGRAEIKSYWDLPKETSQKSHDEKYYVHTYRQLLEECVSSHLMSDVPLGMFLSGGLDSSTVAALMTKIRKAPIETFAVGYDESAYSELPYARAVADHIGSHHHEVRVSREEFFSALPKLIWHEDEPLVWPSSISLYFVARLAGESVKVVLTGEGSDETLGGYGRYAWTLWNARWQRIYRAFTSSGLRKGIREKIGAASLLDAKLRRRLGHTFLGRDADDLCSLYFDSFYAAFSESDQADLLLAPHDWTAGAAYRGALSYFENSSGDLLQRLLYTDIKTYLVELCMKQDQMSMAASIESRVPFLDHVLVEFAAAIPSRFKIRGKSGKLTLKAAAKDLLPESIINRRKMGFPTPLAAWLLGPQLESIEAMLLSPRSLSRGLFRPEAVRRLFAEHRANLRDHSDRIWRLLNFEVWQRIFFDRDPAPLESLAPSASDVRA